MPVSQRCLDCLSVFVLYSKYEDYDKASKMDLPTGLVCIRYLYCSSYFHSLLCVSSFSLNVILF